MRSIFIADAHLEDPEAPNYRLLLQFLREKGAGLDELYILGDLFDFLVGSAGASEYRLEEIISVIGAMSNSGCRVTYFEGNHDFHLSRRLSDAMGAEIITGPAVLEIQGKRYMVCHGDLINGEDIGYRRLYRVLRSPAVRWLADHVPAGAAESVRRLLQSRSRKTYETSRKKWDYRKIVTDYGRTLVKEGIQGLVCAHFHFPFREDIEAESFTVVSLGDWLGQFSYAEMTDGSMELLSYPQ